MRAGLRAEQSAGLHASDGLRASNRLVVTESGIPWRATGWSSGNLLSREEQTHRGFARGCRRAERVYRVFSRRQRGRPSPARTRTARAPKTLNPFRSSCLFLSKGSNMVKNLDKGDRIARALAAIGLMTCGIRAPLPFLVRASGSASWRSTSCTRSCRLGETIAMLPSEELEPSRGFRIG